MAVTAIPMISIPGQVYPELGMVIVFQGKRYQVTGFNRTTINVLGVDGKTYKLSLRGTGAVTPDADQTWTVAEPVRPDFLMGQVVKFVGARAVAKFPGLYVVVKTGDSVNVSPLGGDVARPGSYVRVHGLDQLEIVQGTFQVA